MTQLGARREPREQTARSEQRAKVLAEMAKAGKRRHKFNARRTNVDGITFDSAAEARRWEYLRMIEALGEIHDLHRQPGFPLWAFKDGQPEPIGMYRADFLYCTCAAGKADEAKCDDSAQVVEDVKGFKTALYRWKKKHVEAQYGISIREL